MRTERVGTEEGVLSSKQVCRLSMKAFLCYLEARYTYSAAIKTEGLKLEFIRQVPSAACRRAIN
jgi:hypothetical protein